jgi:hypothetical protein
LATLISAEWRCRKSGATDLANPGINPVINKIRLLKGAVHSGAQARLRFLKQLHRFMADCSITAGIHLIVAQGFVTKNNASPSRPYALT